MWANDFFVAEHKTHEEKKMIKSEVRRSPTEALHSYPCLLEFDKYIVFFDKVGQGMVVHVKMDK
jgi:hypothetical protein